MVKKKCAFCKKEIDPTGSKFSLISHHPHYPITNPFSEVIVHDEKEAYLFLAKKYGENMPKIRSEKNLFIEMVQIYLDYKKINAKATINKDGHLDIHVDMNTSDSKKLSKLLSQCMPISYVITNTAKGKWMKFDRKRSLMVKILQMIKSGKQIHQCKISDEKIYLFEYDQEYLITNSLKFHKGQFCLYNQINLKTKRIRVFLTANKEKFPESEDFYAFMDKLPSELSEFIDNKTIEKTERVHCKKCRKKVDAIVKDDELICPNCSKSLGAVFYKKEKPEIDFYEKDPKKFKEKLKRLSLDGFINEEDGK